MKNSIILIILFLFFTNNAISAVNQENIPSQNLQEMVGFDDLKNQLRQDFAVFLQELYNEKQRGKKETERMTSEMNEILRDSRGLIKESRADLSEISYMQSKNLLIASVFLWISITIFIVMNLVFANNLKKEMYFLRNGLLRGEIKENMLLLVEQLNTLNDKLDSMNKKG